MTLSSAFRPAPLLRIIALALFSLLSFILPCKGEDAHTQNDLEAKPSSSSRLNVFTLHPILGDLAKQVGGDFVVVTDILKPNGNLHGFEPSPADLKNLSKANIILASGKNLEPYLHKLKDNLSAQTHIVDVGATIPDVKVSPENAAAACCEHGHDHAAKEEEKQEKEEGECEHNHGALGVDPHWWHSSDNIALAARALAASFSSLLPEQETYFTQRAQDVEKKCRRLKVDAKRALMHIPKEKRILVTGHAAFGHLCKELDFEPIALQGISGEDEGSGRRIADMIKQIRERHIEVIFPEYQANPKTLDEIAQSSGIRIGAPLVSDGLAPDAHTFETMYRHNVKAIADALSPPKDSSPTSSSSPSLSSPEHISADNTSPANTPRN